MYKLFRRQRTTNENHQLSRSLTLTNLVFLSISSSIGTGIFILTGEASHSYAGQFIPISYLISAVPCFLSALCFAEFSARVNTTGSTYSFLYNSIGEIFAFVVGWSVILGSFAGIAASSLAWSTYVDAIFDGAIKNFTINRLHIHWNLTEPFNDYVDFPALTIIVILFIITYFGVEFTASFNNVLATTNILLLSLMIVVGFYFGDFANLTSVPYTNGIHGIIKASSIIYYAYFGFESTTCAIAEAKNPGRTVPLSMIIALTVVAVLYSFTSLSLNLMVPYTQIDVLAPFPKAFQSVPYMHLVISFGVPLCLTGTLLMSMYSLGRMIYAISIDGLLFKSLAKVHQKYKVPYIANITGFVICVFLVVLFDIKDLIGFSNITGFLSYSLVSTALLVVRYCDKTEYNALTSTNRIESMNNQNDEEDDSESIELFNAENNDDIDTENDSLLGTLQLNRPTIIVSENKQVKTSKIRECLCFFTKYRSFRPTLSLVVTIFMYCSNVFISTLMNYVQSLEKPLLVVLITVNLISIFILFIFCEQDTAGNANLLFKIPLVPLIPIASAAFNIYLMMSIGVNDWIGFGIITVIGLPIYFLYGIRHSKLL